MLTKIDEDFYIDFDDVSTINFHVSTGFHNIVVFDACVIFKNKTKMIVDYGHTANLRRELDKYLNDKNKT